MKHIKISTVAAGTAALLVAGLAVGYGAGTATASTSPHAAGPRPRSGATPAAAFPSSVLDGTTASSLTPIRSCRVVDTRSGGGPLSNNVPRSFQIGGTTGFASQGPTSGCAIPVDATAVTGTITMVSASANGYIHLYPQGSADPGSSFLNFAKSFNVSGSGLFTLSAAGGVTMKVLGASSNVVIDLTGFYVAPMNGLVFQGGTLAYGSRIAAVSHPSTGLYELTYDRDVTSCAFSVTTLINGLTAAADAGDDPNQSPRIVDVVIEDLSSTRKDEAFYIQATC